MMCKKCTPILNDPVIGQVIPSLSPSLEKEKINAEKGLLLEGGLVLPGHFDITKYDFLVNNPPCPESAHPNLWEHAKVNMIAGLFRVNNIDANKDSDAEARRTGNRFSVITGDVFQIRGYDISNMTLLYGSTGWIVMDVLTVNETAMKAWELVKTRLIDKPIKAVIYSHSHTDHYGGVGGIRDAFDTNCGYSILAPEGFTKHVVSENIYAGTAMQRRAFYQFGHMLPPGVEGQIDAGLGKITAKGQISLIPPTEELGFDCYVTGKNYVEKLIDGVTLQFQLTPGTEAPAEMNVYAPGYKVLFIAENCTGTLHNTLTPRGAQVRDALEWANYIDQTLTTFSDLQVVCSSHNWPHFTNADCIAYMELQRDLYRYIHNATLHLVNLGYTIDEVGRMLSDPDIIPMPDELANEWCNHGFYGTVNHDAKAVYQRYLGWYDGNPAHLNRPLPADLATEYVKAFGADAILKSGAVAASSGKDEWAMELFHHILYADPDLTGTVIDEARKQYITVLKKAGFKSEGATWRNMYLTGAYELQTGLPPSTFFTLDDYTVSAMSLEMILQFMGIMLQSKNVEARGYRCKVNIILTDTCSNPTGQIALVKIGRGILHYRIVPSSGLYEQPDITVKGLKKDFFRAFIDKNEAALEKIVTNQEISAALEFISYLTQFKVDFPIMTPRPADL